MQSLLLEEAVVPSDVFEFGPFRIYAARRLLLRHDEPVRLGSRAFDILLALAERAGDIVSKDELTARVWPHTFVDEANLRVHVSALRKAFGENHALGRIIENIPGRGYSFVAEMKHRDTVDGGSPAPTTPVRAGTLPVAVSRMFGRDETVREIASLLQERRAITVVGPGGIGKTTVALAAGRFLELVYKDGVVFFDLSMLRDAALLPNALATRLGHVIHTDDAVNDLVGVLAGRRLLLVLDGCEHLIDAAAYLAETLLERTTGVDILATSREPLRIVSEWVQRLAALDMPPPSMDLTAEQALRYSAIELFVERASASLGGYLLTDDDVPVVIEICRRLDGIALALELAAARLDPAGMYTLASSLDDRFRVLTHGRRTALPRHQTLRATHDWSYDLLTKTEKFVFRHLGVFSGNVTLAAVQAVAVGDGVVPDDVNEHLVSLTSKSLVVMGAGRTSPTYRLLDTTRAYAREKLTGASERDAAMRRHADFFMCLFECAANDRLTAESVADCREHLGDVRLALDWAFNSGGDAKIGVALTVASIPIWFQLSLLDECLACVQQALHSLNSIGGDVRRWKMQLSAALGWPQMRPVMRLQNSTGAWQVTLNLAEEIGDVDYQERSLWALWVDAHNRGEPREALEIAERFCALSACTHDPAGEAVGHRLRARSLLMLGDPRRAHDEISLMLKRYVAPARYSHSARLQYDQEVTAHVTLQRVLWIKGFPDAAMRDVEANLEVARSLGHGLSLSHALSDGACPVALLAGDLTTADRYIGMLREQTIADALDVWHTYAEAYDGEVRILRGEMPAGIRLLRNAVTKLREAGFVLYLAWFLGILGEAMAKVGQEREGLALIDEALMRCERSGEAWCLAELWRQKGIVLASDAPSDGEACLRRAVEIARVQGALSWELRSSTSLAHHYARTGRERVAAAILAPVLTKFTEGFDRPDLRRAQADLATWTGPPQPSLNQDLRPRTRNQ